jgi:hypothetical protein
MESTPPFLKKQPDCFLGMIDLMVGFYVLCEEQIALAKKCFIDGAAEIFG